jgi:hypothetical protein
VIGDCCVNAWGDLPPASLESAEIAEKMRGEIIVFFSAISVGSSGAGGGSFIWGLRNLGRVV